MWSCWYTQSKCKYKAPQGETLFAIAAQNGIYKAMHHFLNVGSAINMTDSLGNTALMVAVGCSAIPKYSLILRAGAQMYLLHQMKTVKSDVLRLCKMQSKSLQCIQLLLTSGIMINHSNNFDENALQYYLLNFESHCKDIIMLLIAAGEVSNRKLNIISNPVK